MTQVLYKMGAAGADYNSARGIEQVTFVINDQVKSQRMMLQKLFPVTVLVTTPAVCMIDTDSGASWKGLQRSGRHRRV